MKRISNTITAAIIGCTILFSVAESNYNAGIWAAAKSEGTDAAIVEAMRSYGFDQRWWIPEEDITFVDKVTALFKH